jgi:hypothetical protein
MNNKLKLKEKYTDKEKEKLELTNKLFNANFDNNKILFNHLINQLWYMILTLIMFIILLDLL